MNGGVIIRLGVRWRVEPDTGCVPDTHNDAATELASLNSAQNNSGTKMLKDKAVSFGTL